MRARLRRYFITGLIVFLPIAVTISVLLWLFGILDSLMGWLFTLLIGHPVLGLGVVATILVIFMTGALATNVLGRRVVARFDGLMLRLPLARSIYSATKQLSDSIFAQHRAAFQRAVLIEWPRQGMYTVGFVTGETGGRTQEIAGRRIINVFVMSTPNPTTGFLVLVPEDQVHQLDMSVEEGLKLMMSGGIVSPPSSRLPVPVPPGAEGKR
jgi:uncharacterized membrane protein